MDSASGSESAEHSGSQQKGSKMFRKTTFEVTTLGLALTVLASVAQAETTELTDAQMDQITAGAFQVVPGTFNLVDSQNPQKTYTFRSATLDFTDGAVVWTPVAVYWYGAPTNLAFGVLTSANGQVAWDGGYTVTTGPISGTPTQIVLQVSGVPTKVL
jgi:hypothetical protein